VGIDGLLNPQREPGTQYRCFTPTDVRDARMIHMLRQGHYPLPQIQLILGGLRETGSTEALRAAVAERQESLHRQARAMLDGSGRLHHYLTPQ
jgi:DNA-binding transcriptional MerR regulator